MTKIQNCKRFEKICLLQLLEFRKNNLTVKLTGFFFVLIGKVYLHNLELYVSAYLNTISGNIYYLFKC